MVTGEKNSSTPGGMAGPPCPGVINMVDCPSRLGVAQQHVTVKKLTVRKPKLWPRNSPTEWNQPRQWQKI